VIDRRESIGLWDEDEFYKKTIEDFDFFRQHLCGRTSTWFQKEWVNAFENYSISLVEAARQHGKTITLAVDYPLWKLWQHEDYSFLVAAQTSTHSSGIIGEIRRTITNSELLTDRLYPDNRSTTWSKTHAITRLGGHIYAKPNTQNIVGGTHDRILNDEISLWKYHEVYYNDILPMTAVRRGHIMNIGTPKSKIDLLAKLREEYRDRNNVYYGFYPIYVDNDPEKGPIWPEKYNKKYIDEEILPKYPGIAFTREFRLRVTDQDTQAYPSNYVTRAMSNGCELYYEMNPVPGATYYGAGDMAASPTGDYNVYCFVRKVGKRVKLAYMMRKKGMSIPSRADDVNKLLNKYRPETFHVDEEPDGRELIRVLQQEHDRAGVYGFSFKSGRRYKILENLASAFENDRIILPCMEGDYYTSDTSKILEAELTDILRITLKNNSPSFESVGAHDDTVMAFALAVYAATGSANIDEEADYVDPNDEDYFCVTEHEMIDLNKLLQGENEEEADEDTYLF